MPPTSEVPLAEGHAEVMALMTHACLPPKVTITRDHAEAKAHMLPGCHPASSCSAPYALRLPPASEVPLAGGHADVEALITPACLLPKVPLAGGRVEVKATRCQSTSPRSRCTPQHPLPPAYRGASKDPVPPACSPQSQRPPEDRGGTCLWQGTSPKSSLRRRPCPALDPPTARVTAQGSSVREDRKDSPQAFFGPTDLHPTCRGSGGQGLPAALQTTLRPTARGQVNKIFMQLYPLPYALRLACRLISRSHLLGAMQRSRP